MTEKTYDKAELLDGFSANVYSKGHTLQDKGQVEAGDRPGTFRARGKYRVQLYPGLQAPIQATCTCPHGMNHVNAQCYHAAAAILLALELGQVETIISSGEEFPTAAEAQEAAEAGAPADPGPSLDDIPDYAGPGLDERDPEPAQDGDDE